MVAASSAPQEWTLQEAFHLFESREVTTGLAFFGCIVSYMNMGRIIVPVRIENVFDSSKGLTCEALVDTGASLMVLPKAWKDRLGDLEFTFEMEVEVATQEAVKAEVCGPVRIQIEGFRPISSEVVFVDMKPGNGTLGWLHCS